MIRCCLWIPSQNRTKKNFDAAHMKIRKSYQNNWGGKNKNKQTNIQTNKIIIVHLHERWSQRRFHNIKLNAAFDLWKLKSWCKFWSEEEKNLGWRTLIFCILKISLVVIMPGLKYAKTNKQTNQTFLYAKKQYCRTGCVQ